MAKTISQRITLEGSEDIRKKLEELGKTGEEAFKKLQDAAKKPITDPVQIEKTGKAIDDLVKSGAKLSQQFSALATNAKKFGTDGAQATKQVTDGLKQTNTAAQQAGQTIQQAGQQAQVAGASAGAGLVTAATRFGIAAAAIYAAITAITTALTKGSVETGSALADAAKKIGLTIPQWLALRQAIADSSISNEDFIKSATKIAGLMEKAAGGTARLSDSVTEQTLKFGDATVTVTRFNDTVTKTDSEASKAATELRKLGVSMDTIAKGETQAALRQVAEIISKIPDALKRAEAGTKVFGSNWEQVIKVLLAGKQAVDNTGKSLAEIGKASRDMSADQIEKGVKLKASWEDLSAAIRATKDQIGALFLDPALARAEWLTKIVDGSRELFRQWVGLAEQKRKTFVEGLGEGPTETAFKLLIAVGEQLAGIWRDVLVPAGAKLLELVEGIAGSFEGVTKSQVAAFFITAAIAAAGLAIALKAIGFLLTPVSLLISLFTGFGPILLALGVAAFVFWDQIKAGAEMALKAVAPLADVFNVAFQQLLAGDFAGFWENFSGAAIAAFNRIKAAILEQNPALAEFFAAVNEIAKELPAAVLLIITAFVALRFAAIRVATVINAIFGTKLTGTGVLVVAILTQLTGVLAGLASVAVIVGVAFGILFGAIGALAAVIGGPATAAVLAFIAILAGFAFIWSQLKADAIATWNAIVSGAQTALAAITALVTTPIANAWQWIVDTFNAVIDAVMAKIREAAAALAALLTGSAEQGGSTGAPAGPGFARGGHVGGRGTGTSDSNLAWISRGEHIMPARAVRQPGVLAFLEALRRSGGNLRHVLDGLRGFALGGLVTMPAFASGGLNGMSNVTIQFPGLPAIGGLRAPGDVVEELRKAAAMAQVRSGGRKPSRYS